MVYISRIVTKGGDSGMTSLGDGTRVPKSDTRIAAIGVIDELNATIGLVIVHYMKDCYFIGLLDPLRAIQNDLFDIGADLAVPYVDLDNKLRLKEEQIMRLEQQIALDNASLEPLNSFILPGGTVVASYLHFARTVCRRAERTVVSLGRFGHRFNPEITIYLNRLGDLLFVWSRLCNQKDNKDVLWEPGKNQEGEKNESK